VVVLPGNAAQVTGFIRSGGIPCNVSRCQRLQ
jgi:hypothetical protein